MHVLINYCNFDFDLLSIVNNLFVYFKIRSCFLQFTNINMILSIYISGINELNFQSLLRRKSTKIGQFQSYFVKKIAISRNSSMKKSELKFCKPANRFFSQLPVVFSAIALSFIHLSWLCRGNEAFFSTRPWDILLKCLCWEFEVSLQSVLSPIG